MSHWCLIFINFLQSLLSYTPNGHAAHTLLLVSSGVSLVSNFYQFSGKPSIVHSKITCQRWDLTSIRFLSIFCKAFYRTLQMGMLPIPCYLSALVSHWCPIFINFLKSLLSYTPKLLVSAAVSPVSGFYQFSEKPSIVHSKWACCRLSALESHRCPIGLCRQLYLTGVPQLCEAILYFINIIDKIKKFSLQA